MFPLEESAALVIAHPGHEARLHGWVERARPRVFVITDGSGRAGLSRIGATARALEETGARRGSVFGRFTDLAVYRAMLDQDFSLFARLADELAAQFVSDGVRRVVADAAEGYNSTHDACRLVADAAVAVANGADARAIESYDFPVVSRPDDCPAHARACAVWLRLDDDAFARKLDSARRHYPELVAESRAAYSGRGAGVLRDYLKFTRDDDANGASGASASSGLDLFRVECLRPINGRANGAASSSSSSSSSSLLSSPSPSSSSPSKPFYELHSERQGAAGHYERVIRYREHLLPLADALCEHVGRRVG
jgi:hypothetical protein